MSTYQQSYPPPALPDQTPPPKKTTSGLAIAGFILAFLLAPIGFILSLIGLIVAGSRGQKGKGLAIAGMIVSVLFMAIAGVAIVTLGGNLTTIADPGCTSGKATILDNASKVSDPAGLQTMIDGLNAAAGKATHSNVHDAMKTLADDYTKLQTGDTDSAFLDKVTTDAKAIDTLCTFGG